MLQTCKGQKSYGMCIRLAGQVRVVSVINLKSAMEIQHCIFEVLLRVRKFEPWSDLCCKKRTCAPLLSGSLAIMLSFSQASMLSCSRALLLSCSLALMPSCPQPLLLSSSPAIMPSYYLALMLLSFARSGFALPHSPFSIFTA